MTKLRKTAAFFLGNFGNITAFYAVNHVYGLLPAIAASTLVSFAEIAWKLATRQTLTSLFKFTAGMTLAFGLVDLYFNQVFLFKYEACVSSVFAGCFFGLSLVARKTVLQDMLEAQDPDKPMTPERIAYLKLLTALWTAYFFVKAAAYFVVATRLSLEEGLAIRVVLGSASLYAMLAFSIFGSKIFFPFLKRNGWLSVMSKPR